MNFGRSNRSKLFSLLISFVLAVLLWSMLNMDSNNIVSRSIVNIPVTMINEDSLANKGLTIDKNINYYVNLEIRGTEENISAVNPENLSAEIDLAKVVDAGTQSLEVVIKGLNNTVILVDTVPSSIQITVDYFATENITPEILTQGIPGDNYNVIFARTEDTVNLEGPNSELQKVDSVSGIVNVNGLTENTREFVQIYAYDIDGNRLDGITCTPNMVLATVYIGITKEVPINNPPITGTPAEGYKITSIELSPKKVLIAGDPNVISNITVLDLKSIDIPTNSNNQSFSVNSSLTIPEGVFVLDHTEEVEVTVNIEQIIEKKYVVSTLEPIGLGENLEISKINPGSVTLTVKATASELEKIDASTLKGNIDCTGLGVGNYNLNVSFNLDNITIVSIEPSTVEIEIVNKV